MEENNRKKIRKKELKKPAYVCLSGIVIWAVSSKLTESVNVGALLGILMLMFGTVFFASELYKEIFRTGIEMPMFLDNLFPDYPIVEDRDEVERHLSGFRSALNEYFSSESDIINNSSLQIYSSQLLWHSMSLWKKRMARKGITLSLESNRRAYTSKKNSVRQTDFFDGRYNVKDVCEEIDATRSFYYNGRLIKKLCDREVAHYTILSAKEMENGKFICPHCGGYTTRDNLIDGCDYCGTKFTVEDIENRVGLFGLRHDFSVRESKREAIREIIYPWVFVITEMPFVYFGFFGAIVYMDESIFARIITGMLAAGLLGLFGYFFAKINTMIALPFVMMNDKKMAKINRKIVYRSAEEIQQEQDMAKYVRQFDYKFSIESFLSGIQNKLYAIHFADKEEQINAFSEVDLSTNLAGYNNIIDVDVVNMKLCSYDMLEGNKDMPDGVQNAVVEANMTLREFMPGKFSERTEHVKMHLSKNGRLRTQAVCGPSLMKCEKCGASLTLMEGKVCSYCGNELDLKKFDWIITDYKVLP